MARTRKLTLSVKEFSHLVSESLDMANCPQSLVDNNTLFSETPQKTHVRLSSFQRIFSRPTPTPGQYQDSTQGPSDDLPETPRKMISWPFSRSPRKSRHTKDEDNATEPNDPDAYHATSPGPYSVSSLAAGSTSSLGSLVPANERLFQVISRESDEPSQNCHVFRVANSSPVTVLPPPAGEFPTASGCYAHVTSLDANFGNGSSLSVLASSAIEPGTGLSSRRSSVRASSESTETPRSVVHSQLGRFDEDPTPRAATFDPCATLPHAAVQDDASLVPRRRPERLSLMVPSRNVDVLALRPAVGVAPHVPSETESSISACSTSSPTSPIARSSSPSFPTIRPSDPGTSSECVPPTPPNARVPAMSPSIASPSNPELALPVGFSPRQRKRALSRSQTPPPLPRPPPTGPLPAVPSSVPPVPPLPPLLCKMNLGPHSVISSPPRSSMAGGSANLATALPPSPPGGLRLPSRLSWVGNVRAVLPSPPASPTKSLRSLAGKTLHSISPPKAEIKRPGELKRPTSIGVIEAADNVQVRRTKSILLLGSKSKSNVSLGMKRVQIHADGDDDAGPVRKPRRKSSAAALGHPVSCIDFRPIVAPMQSSELLVPRERRHSAPVLSSLDPKGASADWTLSLPFCTDVPGHKILVSPMSMPQLKSEQGMEDTEVEDWTLCMPLKVRVGSPTVESAEVPESECTHTDVAETVETRPTIQLPTPSPSPTLSTPTSIVCPLDPEESVPSPVERPASRASLGPHVGGLDLAGGRGKRASGWHVYGWFDEVCLLEDDCDMVSSMPTTPTDNKLVKSHVAAFRKTHDLNGRHPSQDSMTSDATFYSARSTLLVN